ncbi:hypothetical protein [Pyxidicoccus sp. MSG2]|uniref:hypothetical protein n=1 Tax=Pyxidicoccus sp. MSG2 TaxID=2996790 RepID=UPI002271375F|nr:hypothetical protein [Pyxidicoccus sp. MSG2]MCY1015797.1 hypothetical protein [Pyxidicoccus sp. MSG2]
MKSKSFAVVVAAVLGAVGCAGGARTEAGQLKAGDRVALTLSADGKSAQAITSDSTDDDAETNDDQEGPDGDGDGETNDDQEGPDGDGDGETNDDGPTSGISSDLTSSSAGEVLAPRSGVRELSAGSFEALGMKIQAQALPADSAAVRFVGSVNPDGTFVASSVKGSRAAHSALRGTLQAVERTGNGTVTLQVLGQAVTVSETAKVDLVKSLDEESAKEDDGID